MDVVLSFFTGYLQKGNLILNHGDIARHYLRLGKECVTWVEAVAHAAGIHFQPWLQIFFSTWCALGQVGLMASAPC